MNPSASSAGAYRSAPVPHAHQVQHLLAAAAAFERRGVPVEALEALAQVVRADLGRGRSAVALALLAMALMPTAVAFTPEAFELAPIAVESIPLALDPKPKALALVFPAVAADGHLAGFGPARVLHGAVQYSLGSIVQAETILSALIREYPGDVTVRRLLGATLVARNESTRALEIIQHSLPQWKAQMK